MIIGIDIRTLMDKHYSGVSEYTLNLLWSLFKNDTENEYRLYYNSWSDISDCLPKFENTNVKIIKTDYPNKVFNYLLQNIFHYPKIDKVLGGVDVFFSPHINFLSLSKNCFKVITVHDLSFLRYREFFSHRKNFWHKTVNVKKLLSRFDRIVAVSQNTKNDLIEILGINPERITVIHSGISSEFGVLDKNDVKLSEIKKKYNLADNFFLYLGNLEPRKNLAGLISAYDIFRDNNQDQSGVKLVLAGATGWKVEDIFMAQKNSPYSSDIIFIGYVDRSDKVSLYNLASAFVYPSFYEGFGFPPLEALACGLPVISSAVSSLPEILGEAAILVDPDNVESLAKAMEIVIGDDKLRDSLKEKGLGRIKNFSWERASREYLKLLTNKNHVEEVN